MQMVSGDRAGDGEVHRTRIDNGLPQCGRPSYEVTLSGSGVTQWNESPQAHEPVAIGLSIVNPCFSMVSTKSIVAPPR